MKKITIFALTFGAVALTIAPAHVAQARNIKREDNACLSSFSFSKLRKSKNKIINKNYKAWTDIRDAASTYAMCQSLVWRNPNSCKMLKIFPGNLERTCHDNFYWLLFIRDMGAHARTGSLDALDFESCAHITHLPANSQKNRNFCIDSVQEFATRTNVCGAMKYLVPPDQAMSAIQQCRNNLENFIPAHTPPDMSDVATKISSCLWNKTTPTCNEVPFNSPMREGACLGIFYGRAACANILRKVKSTYCSALSSR